MMPGTELHCPHCGRSLSPSAPEGLCPACLAASLSELMAGAEEDAGTLSPLAAPHERVGSYELLDELGRGGMGVVFRARDLRLQRVVALKLMLTGQLASEAEVKRFRNEAEAAAQLEHPHIVPIYEVGESEGRQFFTMKLVEGGTLAEALSRSADVQSAVSPTASRQPQETSDQLENVLTAAGWKPAIQQIGHLRYDRRRIATLLAAVARAVHHAHQRGILHRDLKPGNILLDADGQPMVSDFGLARRIEAEGGLTQSGTVLGSPSYMAPEQALGGARATTTAADIYSLGAILYELLCGRPPFVAETPLETLRQVLEEEPVAPRQRATCDWRITSGQAAGRTHRESKSARWVDCDLETICLKCLQKDPRQRYATAEALAEDLERWLRREPILARPSSVWEQTVKWIRRWPAAAALVAVSAVSVIGFVTLLAVTGVRLRAERNHARAQEEVTRQSLYAADIYLAQQALNSGNLGLARHALAAHQPASGRKDLRGFEWRYLWARCQGDQVATLRGHASAVSCLGFSSDGRWLASGSDDRTIRVWDMETRQMRLALDRFEDAVVAVAFSPEGGQIIAGTADAVVTTWDLATRSRLRICRAYGQITLAPQTGQAVFSWSSFPKTGREEVVTLYDLDSAIPLHTLRQAGGRAAVSHDGQRLASASPSGLKLWDAESGRVLSEWTSAAPLSAFTFSRDDRLLAALANGGRTVQIWEVAGGVRLAEFAVPEARFHDADFSPDGQWLATGGTDQSIHLWQVAQRALRASLKGHENEIRAVTFSPDGRRLASAGKDGTVRLWKGGVPEAVALPTNTFPVCALSSNGKRFATQDRAGRSTNVNILLWDVASWQPAPLPHSRGAQPVAFLDGDTTLLTMRRPVSGGVLWLDFHDLARGSNRFSLSLPQSDRPRVATDYAPRSGLFALSSYYGDILVWRASDGQLLATLRGPSAEVSAIRFSPDGRTLAAFTQGAGLTLWDVATGKERLRPVLPSARAADLAFSADGTLLAAADSSNAIRLWHAVTGEALTTFTGHAEPVVRLAFAPEGQTLASASEDGTVKLWSLAARREFATIFRGDTLAHLQFTPDGQTLLGASPNGHLHAWGALEIK